MLQVSQSQHDNLTINKTLLTARLMDGFWERWLAHGIERADLNTLRESLTSKENWITLWGELANKKYDKAREQGSHKDGKEAELSFRTAGLYYQLIQWLIPENNEEKFYWLQASLTAFEQADEISGIETKYAQISMEGKTCFGRIRIPLNPKGVITIINPLDSTKEELFTYEMDFVDQGFITISFDGPGQGETYTSEGLKATAVRWRRFVDEVIDYSYTHFPSLPVYLFGTSSGAAWAIYGSCHPKVSKVVAISPPFISNMHSLPDYFIERMECLLEQDHGVLPDYDQLQLRNPILLVHGKMDVMVSTNQIYDLYNQLLDGKRIIEYESEGHCCNNKLPEIRQYAMKWFMGDEYE